MNSGKFYQWSELGFVKVIEGYGRMVRVVLRHQTLTLLVALGTVALTAILFMIVPKGFFPVQDTGVILGISEAPETVSFAAMAERQQQLANVILQDPAVKNISSFIGVDGTNTTPNAGRIQITLKPLAERSGSAVDIIRRLQTKLSQVPGITLYMQPVQDLTVEDRISRTQYQYALDAPQKEILDEWIPKVLARLKQIPELRDVASDQQNNGLGLKVDIDRDTAGRLGITPQNVDDTLYDAFGQRQVSTIFTQSNQYHVILEAGPQWQQSSEALAGSARSDWLGFGQPGFHGCACRNQYRSDRRGFAAAGAARNLHAHYHRSDSDLYQSPGAISGRNAVVQPRSGRFAGHRRRAHSRGHCRDRHAGQHRAELPGNGRCF